MVSGFLTSPLDHMRIESAVARPIRSWSKLLTSSTGVLLWPEGRRNRVVHCRWPLHAAEGGRTGCRHQEGSGAEAEPAPPAGRSTDKFVRLERTERGRHLECLPFTTSLVFFVGPTF